MLSALHRDLADGDDPHDTDGPRRDMGGLYRAPPTVLLSDPERAALLNSVES